MRKKFLIFSIVCLLFCTLSYTYSSFKNTIVGNISGNIKDWVFKVSIDNSTKYEDGYKLHLTGTSGSFNININTVGGSKNANYSIELIGDSSIKYYTDSNYTKLIDNNIYKGSINSNTSGNVTIYYKSSSNINNDILIKTKGSIMEYAEMKNGAYGGNRYFWKDDYRGYIRTIELKKDLNNLPSSCTEENLCWDISSFSTQSKKVYSYLIDSGFRDKTDSSKILYDLYIASEALITAPDNCVSMFAEFSNLISINFNGSFNTSNVTGMHGMFNNCSSLTSLDLSGFNTSKVTDMSYMFYSCKVLTSLDLSNFNTSNVTDMDSMFFECIAIINLDLNNFNTSNVTNMHRMFSWCKSLTKLDLSSFNTSNVTAMGAMFWFCSSLANLDLSTFNTSKVTNMYYMFSSCSKLTTSINIMNANITNYSSMFSGAATASGAKITVNYIENASTLVDNMIATKSSNSNVVKSSIIPE